MHDREARDRLDAARMTALAMLSALTREFAGIVDASSDSNADDEHDPEGSTIAFERSQVSALIDQTRQRLADIEAAITRVDDGTYAVCETCGTVIPAARLEARPVARTCVECA